MPDLCDRRLGYSEATVNITILPAAWAPSLQSILRVVTGLLFLEHGSGKLLSFPVLPGVAQMLSPTLLHFTGAMELVGGALIVVGFLTRPVAFILSGYMAVAYFMAHFPKSVFPAINFGEPAVLFCFVFLYLAVAGAGPWAIDKAKA